jgi:hypothetical protein
MFLSVPGRTEGEKARVVWVSADQAGVPYKETEFSSLNYQRWSDKFSDPPKEELPKELLLDPDEPIPPGRTLRILSSRGLEILDLEFLSKSLLDSRD